MKKYLHTYLLLLLSFSLQAQTVVKMKLPPQAEKPLDAVTLFDDALAGSMPTAIGFMGYDVEGGTLPYTYHWLENEIVIHKGETALITPASGKTYALRIVDRNNCSVTLPIEVDHTKGKTTASLSEGDGWVETWLTRQTLSVKLNANVEEASLRLYDIGGKLLLQKDISASAEISLNLSPGIYLLHLNFMDLHGVMKHIIN